MKRFMCVAALLACACTPAAEDPAPTPTLERATLDARDMAGNRMETLTEQDGRWCSGDGAWCVWRDADSVNFTHAGQDAELLTYDETTTPEVWAAIVRDHDDQSVMIGLEWTESQMYSGGGGGVTKVTLYRITPGSGLIPEVLTWPKAGEISIRACFDEDDVRARRQACLDTYTFVGDLALDAQNASGPPRLALTTLATSYPRGVSRHSDSTENAPLQQDDLVIVRDETCSYRRTLAFNGEAYQYNQAPPECPDYLEP